MESGRYPTGGMSTLTMGLRAKARENKVKVLESARVEGITKSGEHYLVHFKHEKVGEEVQAKYVFCGIAKTALQKLLGEKAAPPDPLHQGNQTKINILLQRLPKLAHRFYKPEQAFAGTFHVNEGARNLEESANLAALGTLPGLLPFEIYSHSMTDRSIFGERDRSSEKHTLSMFVLNTPYSLFAESHYDTKQIILSQVMRSLDTYLGEPVMDCIAQDKHSKPCIQVISPLDLENTLGMPQGNIFHGPLQWPFAESSDEVGSWGVETHHPNIYICGSSAKRGGCVSGLPGYYAYRKVLEQTLAK